MKQGIKKWKIVVFLIITLFGLIGSSANMEAKDSKKAEFVIKNGVLKKYTGKRELVFIPEGVVVIGERAFEENLYLKKVVLPDSVEELEDEVFDGCTNLQEVILSSKIRKMGISSFKNCVNLANITWPAQFTQIPDYTFMGSGLREFDFTAIEKIGTSAFAQTKLQVVNLSNRVKQVSTSAFAYCEKLVEINLSNQLTNLPASFCSNSKIRSIYIPNSVQKIGEMAFANCSKLDVISGGKNVEEIKSGAFYGTGWEEKEGQTILIGTVYMKSDGLQEQVIIPEGVTMIYDEAFTDNQKLRQVTIPSSVRIIGMEAFLNCKRLNKVVLKNGLLSIGEASFRHCISLEKIEIPESVQEIKSYAFAECRSLSGYQFPENEIAFGDNVFYGVEQGNAGEFNEFIIANKNTLIAYVDSANEEELRIPEGVEKIGQNVFQTYHIIGTLYIPGTVKEIELGSFEYAEISHIVLAEGVKEIKPLAFYHCVTDKITIPSSVEKIEALFVWKKNKRDITVVCEKNSVAYKYAKRNNITIQLQFY